MSAHAMQSSSFCVSEKWSSFTQVPSWGTNRSNARQLLAFFHSASTLGQLFQIRVILSSPLKTNEFSRRQRRVLWMHFPCHRLFFWPHDGNTCAFVDAVSLYLHHPGVGGPQLYAIMACYACFFQPYKFPHQHQVLLQIRTSCVFAL